MAIAKSVVFDKMKGSMGNVTIVRYHSNQVIVKSKISDPRYPNTPGQQLQKSYFTLTVDMAKMLKLHIREAFETNVLGRSNYNEFVSVNTRIARDKAVKNIEDLTKNAQYTKGDLYVVPFVPSFSGQTDNGDDTTSLPVSWTYDPDASNQEGTDKLWVLLFNPSTQSYTLIDTGLTRINVLSSVVLPWPNEDKAYGTLFFRSQLNGFVSSEYAILTIDSAGNCAAIVT